MEFCALERMVLKEGEEKSAEKLGSPVAIQRHEEKKGGENAQFYWN